MRREIKTKEKIPFLKKINTRLDKNTKISIVVIAFIIGCTLIMNNYIDLGLVLNKNIDYNDTIQVELKSYDNSLIGYNDEILTYSEGYMASYNRYGKKTWETEFADTIEADINTAGDYIQIINKDKSLVYILKNKYENARINVEGSISSASITKNGISVIEYSTTGKKTVLAIYSANGELKYNIKLNNKIVGKYLLSDNAKYLVYTDINVNGISAYTNINLIDLSKVSENSTSSNIIYTADNSLVYDIYWNGRKVISRFEDEYMIYDTTFDKKQIVKISSESFVNIGDYASRCAYTQIDQNGGYVLTIRKILNNKETKVKLNDVPKYFTYENGVVYVCYQNRIEAYNNFGLKVKDYTSDLIVTKPIVFNRGKSLAMSISNKLIMFTI